MLIPFIDIKGRTFYVNPVYVRMVQTNKKGQTEICLQWSGSGWATTNIAVVVDRPADDVVRELNGAMPLALDLPPGFQEDDAAAADPSSAVSTAG